MGAFLLASYLILASLPRKKFGSSIKPHFIVIGLINVRSVFHLRHPEVRMLLHTNDHTAKACYLLVIY